MGEGCGKYRPYCVGSASLWKRAIACLARTCCCASYQLGWSRSFSSAVGKTCILRSNVLVLPCLVEVCAGVKSTHVQCFAKERHSECTAAGWKVAWTCRCILTLLATALVYVVGSLGHYDYALEVAAVPVLHPLHVGIAGHCTDRCGSRRMGSPNQAVHHSFAVSRAGVGN